MNHILHNYLVFCKNVFRPSGRPVSYSPGPAMSPGSPVCRLDLGARTVNKLETMKRKEKTSKII